MQIHNLKTWAYYWDAVYSGAKTFELRKNDRAYVEGDMIHLWRWDPAIHKGEIADYDGLPCVSAKITYILPGGEFGLAEDFCILGFKSTNALPDLTAAELERLAWLAEESAEVIKAAMKTVRHGYASYNPHDIEAGDNRLELQREIGDFQGVVELMTGKQDLDSYSIRMHKRQKIPNAAKYLHHQGDLSEYGVPHVDQADVPASPDVEGS